MDFKKHALILAVIEKLRSRGSWTGKTHVQKALALLAESSALDVPFSFVLYKHGPYSFDLEAELEQMRSYSAVDVLPNADGYGVTISPSQMADFVNHCEQLSAEEDAAIERVCDFIGRKTVTELERIATAAWIRNREGLASSNDVAARLHQLKPHVSEAVAKAADRELCAFLGVS